jgi:hypothetical protein
MTACRTGTSQPADVSMHFWTGSAAVTEEICRRPPLHIGCTSASETPRNAENRRDLIRRSGYTRGSAAQVTDLPAQDPAYRPTHPLSNVLTWSGALPGRTRTTWQAKQPTWKPTPPPAGPAGPAGPGDPAWLRVSSRLPLPWCRCRRHRASRRRPQQTAPACRL